MPAKCGTASYCVGGVLLMLNLVIRDMPVLNYRFHTNDGNIAESVRIWLSCKVTCISQQARHWPSVVSVLGQRRRRWPSTDATLGKFLVFAVIIVRIASKVSHNFIAVVYHIAVSRTFSILSFCLHKASCFSLALDHTNDTVAEICKVFNHIIYHPFAGVCISKLRALNNRLCQVQVPYIHVPS